MYKLEEFKPIGIIAIVLICIALLGMLFTKTSFTGMFSLMWAIFIYLILPGYFVMLNFNLNALERIILAMAIGASIIPGILYFINIFGIKISMLNIYLTIAFIIIIAVLYRKFILKNQIKQKP